MLWGGVQPALLRDADASAAPGVRVGCERCLAEWYCNRCSGWVGLLPVLLPWEGRRGYFWHYCRGAMSAEKSKLNDVYVCCRICN